MTQSLRDAAQALLDKLDSRRSFGVELLASEFAHERRALRAAIETPDQAQPAGDAAMPVVAIYSPDEPVDEDGEVRMPVVDLGDAETLAHKRRIQPHRVFDGLVRQSDAAAATAALQADLAERDARIADIRTEWGAEAAALTERARSAESLYRDAQSRIAELEAKLNTPQLHEFAAAVALEAAHQRERWGVSHDAGKEPSDWFWLVGYLAGKALHAATYGNQEKVAHHTISTAAALANWHAHVTGEYTDFRPGIDPVARGIEPAPVEASASKLLGES